MTLGQNIARLRAQKNLSQGDLADALGVEPYKLLEFRNGK